MVGVGCHEGLAMSSREWPFKLCDAKRLGQVAKDMGLTISGFRFNRVTGELWVDTLPRSAKPEAKPVDNPPAGGRPNSFDQVLAQ
jgi:hypothetical protein